ncbi:uncharacterized protein H6S33_011741 [Morchella sextelata]|uniref:uncharacterized protein n=1 Tax=Morchella sextelata TaxID=1174677 RepID=UPI001D053783|nr:uncharacterized protein H6S33_011741 [Morchella sextelata]KAH0610214.1 hypothetical protein H6S33_011741 [Morchella sextelata]
MEEDVEVGKVDPIHICYGSGEYSRSASSKHSWLVENLPKTLTIDNKTTPATIVQAVLHRHHEKITTAAASKAKRALLGNSLKAQAAQYALLPAYAGALEKLDAYVQIAINKNTDRFERIFICPPTSRESFSHCRPFLAIDGTFTKTQYVQTILLAVSIDGDNHGCILAWALVEGENEESWRFFLLNLKAAILEINQPNVTVMSDRDKGLSIATDNVLDRSRRAFCTQHISDNVYKTFRSTARILFKRIAASYTKEEFNERLEALREHSKTAAKYVENIDKTKYCAPYFPGRTYGHLTSNIVESMNNMILEERALPCLDLLDSLWHKVMHLRFQRLKDANKYPSTQCLTVYGQNLLKDSLAYGSTQRKVQMSDENRGRVIDLTGKAFEVNLLTAFCSCSKFQENAVPCVHGIACIHFIKKQPIQYMPEQLTVAEYRNTYLYNFQPIDIRTIKAKNPVTPAKPNGQPDLLETDTIMRVQNSSGRDSFSWIPTNTPRPDSDSYISAFGYTVFTSNTTAAVNWNSQSIPPVTDEEYNQTPTRSNTAACLPPVLSAPRGRPKVVRKRAGDLQKKRQAMSGQLPDFPNRAPQCCSNCKELGHNSRTCRRPPVGV